MDPTDHRNSFRELFSSRHIGPGAAEVREMLAVLGLDSLEDLVRRAVPENIRFPDTLDLPEPLTEEQLLRAARAVAADNRPARSYLGMGYYDCYTPAVILRNILENPGWYTAYTPYQPEISQGRLEALLNFQTMVTDLTAMEIANASMLDEGTAAAEAVFLALNAEKQGRRKLFVCEDVFPQTVEVVGTRARPIGVELTSGGADADLPADAFAAVIQYPAASGAIPDLDGFLRRCRAGGLVGIVATDLLSLCLLTPPGEMGADVVVGSAQRFGVPMGFGGPHAGFLATRERYKRMMPGRLVGVSRDAHGERALRLALQTREQHIRREKATSNICTAQVLLAVMASMYAVYHGPAGLRNIAERVHRHTSFLAQRLRAAGFSLAADSFFDTLRVDAGPERAGVIQQAAAARGINLGRPSEGQLHVALDETTAVEDLGELLEAFGAPAADADLAAAVAREARVHLPDACVRRSGYLEAEAFNRHHSETQMLRYMAELQAKDLSLAQSMIPLGSCTMKLNATAEMIPVTWPEFARMHPFAPADQTQGYRSLIAQLEEWLAAITGFAAVSVQPNAGSQGEYSGLLVIREHHAANGQGGRDVCLIPSSAHGTNPASAVLAGMRVVVVDCDEDGNIDLDDLRAKAHRFGGELGALMVTYPSTHGVFEEGIIEICRIVHERGGQVYLDGANLNALVGLCQPGRIGPDVCHLNLHKTFCIPHGGGGPGVGPLAVAEHLKRYLPSHGVVPECGPAGGITAVSSAPWGSAGILPISWAYIAMMGAAGLTRATQVAVLNANYVAHRLSSGYRILYRGKNGMVAHECIVDVRPFKASADVAVEDVAKRLMDYGFHAPTMSWPVAGTLMIEPTESESREELDRFCDAMLAIREEIREIETGAADASDNVLKNAPHSASHLLSDDWPHPYSRDKAAVPLEWVRQRKFWVPVGRVDNAYGDRNLVCTCAPVAAYA